MKGAAIAAGLLLACLAFALAFLPRRSAIGGSLIAAVAALAIRLLVPAPAVNLVFAGCWISLALAALCVYWPAFAQRNTALAMIFCANAGVWAGLVVAIEPVPVALAPVLAVLFIGFPARLCLARGWTIALRVVTSWLLAVAMLVGAIPHLVIHPGYVPDHRV